MNPYNTKISIADLEKYCNAYDLSYGDFPESTWEGKAVFIDIIERMEKDGLLPDEDAQKIILQVSGEIDNDN